MRITYNYIMSDDVYSIKFHWDALNIVLTALAVTGGLLFFSATMTVRMPLAYVIASVFMLYLIVLVLFVPYRIKLSGDTLTVRKLAGKYIIPLKSITSVEELPDDFMKTASKLFGSNGFCGYWGKYMSPYAGNFTLCVTERKNLIMITVFNEKTGTEKRLAFSCRNKKIITALRQSNG